MLTADPQIACTSISLLLIASSQTCRSSESGVMSLSAENWNRAMRKVIVDLSDEHPLGAAKGDGLES
jgi:hypothetical protein